MMVTIGVSSFSTATRAAILEAVRRFDRFDDDNDPFGEHDMGALTVEGHRVFWKIDYYDRDLLYGSADPSDPAKTTCVLTIMLASEY